MRFSLLSRTQGHSRRTLVPLQTKTPVLGIGQYYMNRHPRVLGFRPINTSSAVAPDFLSLGAPIRAQNLMMARVVAFAAHDLAGFGHSKPFMSSTSASRHSLSVSFAKAVRSMGRYSQPVPSGTTKVKIVIMLNPAPNHTELDRNGRGMLQPILESAQCRPTRTNSRKSFSMPDYIQ